MLNSEGGPESAAELAVHDGPGETSREVPANPKVIALDLLCERRSGVDCRRCQVACPCAAIMLEGTAVKVDDSLCNGCSLCVGICDCFSASTVTTLDYAHRLRRKAQEEGSLVLCCDEDIPEGFEVHRSVAVLPCLAALSPEFITYLLASRAQVSLVHDDAYCVGCARGGHFAPRIWKRAFDLGEAWAGRTVARIDALPEAEGLAQTMAAPGRRELLVGGFKLASEVASGAYRERKSTTVDAFQARREQQRARMRALSAQPVFLTRQQQDASIAGASVRERLMQEASALDPSIESRRNAQGKGASDDR